MIAQTWSVDRQWQKEHNNQKMDMGKQEKDARNMGGGKEKETHSNWARKSSQKQKEAGLGTNTHIHKDGSAIRKQTCHQLQSWTCTEWVTSHSSPHQLQLFTHKRPVQQS